MANCPPIIDDMWMTHLPSNAVIYPSEKICNHVTVQRPPPRPTDRPFAAQAYQCKITQSTGIATQMQLKVLFGRKSHGRPDF